MRTVPLRTAGHHSAAAADAASSRCAGAATAMPLPGSPQRSAVERQRQATHAALHDARIVA